MPLFYIMENVMDINTITAHMNEHHSNELKALVLSYGGFEAKEVALINVSKDGMHIKADNKEVFAPFPSPTQEKDYKDAIIALCRSVNSKKDDKISEEIKTFKDSFNSILLSSISADKKPHISYSPLLKYKNEYYLYISQVAKHYENLKANPSQIQAMFIEDESKTKSILARTRLTYDISVTFLPRDDFFNEVFDSFEQQVGKGGGVSQVREMRDFHLVKITFNAGRFVKGFGQAFDIDAHGNVSHVGGSGMPHAMPHNPHKHH